MNVYKWKDRKPLQDFFFYKEKTWTSSERDEMHKSIWKYRKILTSVTERAESNKPWLDVRAEETNKEIPRKEGALGKEGEKGQINEDALAGSPSLVNEFFC